MRLRYIRVRRSAEMTRDRSASLISGMVVSTSSNLACPRGSRSWSRSANAAEPAAKKTAAVATARIGRVIALPSLQAADHREEDCRRLSDEAAKWEHTAMA